MSAGPSTDAGAPNLNLSPEEKRVYGQYFRQADTEGVGVVTGEIAVEFFEKTKLDSRVLGEIWQLADNENRGFLTPSGFCLALRLIGHAQAGKEPSAEIALQQGPVPRFEGIPIPAAPAPTLPPPPATLQAQGTGGVPVQIPPLTTDKVNQYATFFERQSLQGDKLSGEQAKQIFEKSGLPNEVLGQIWMLADTAQRGALVMTEFIIAMHLLYSMKTGALRGLPSSIPPPLYEAAQRRGAPRQQSPAATAPSAFPMPRQLTGQGPISPLRTGSPFGRAPLGPQSTGDWLVTAADKERFDKIYQELDKAGKGYITGEEAVTFFSSSKLPEETLAQIWDLADMQSKGQLSKDEFAVAMYLIKQQKMKPDGSVGLPTVLPPMLVPPSMRAQMRPGSASQPQPAPPRAPPKAPSAMDDLFGLDDPVPSVKPQVPLSTGGSAFDAFPAASSPTTAASPLKTTATGSTFKPFIPSSTFGRGLTSQPTGGSNSSAPHLSKPSPIPSEGDLLSDDGHDASKDLGSDSTELANLSNQIGSLTKQMRDVQGQRSTTQTALSQSSAQKKNFEERLAQLRTAYEKEAQDVRSLEQQLTVVRAETQKLMTEMVQAEGTLQDIQAKRQQLSTTLQAEQQQKASLKERLQAINAQIAIEKPEVEKLTSELRHQKGLVAISKKQLATAEAEHEKLKTEIDDLTRARDEQARAAASSPVSAQVASPALSLTSANNPFFRRTGSTDILGTFASPAAKTYNDKTFDDVFGSSFDQTSTPPPPAAVPSFQPQMTGASTASVGSASTALSGGPGSRAVPTAVTNVFGAPEHTTTAPFDSHESPSSSRQVSPSLGRVELNNGPGPASNGTSPFASAAVTEPPSVPETTVPATGSQSPFGTTPFGATGEEKRAVTADPFGADQDKAKEDFESAFASFKTARAKSQEPAAAPSTDAFTGFATASEFPPIAELDHDDSSDSESDKGGFDDDFAPAIPAKVPESGSAAPAALPKEPVINDPALAPAVLNTTGFPPAPSATAEEHESSPAAAHDTKPDSDEFDDDFDGLEDAKEGSGDEDFANISRSGIDEFNPVFDSPPSQSKGLSGSTISPFGAESSFDMASASTTQNTTETAPAQTGTASKPADLNDWDALFATLDEPAAAPTVTAPASSGATEPTRPAGPGRALTEAGEHDDPILKNLTSMGYSRKDALGALEKYNYNLERAADHLANQS